MIEVLSIVADPNEGSGSLFVVIPTKYLGHFSANRYDLLDVLVVETLTAQPYTSNRMRKRLFAERNGYKTAQQISITGATDPVVTIYSLLDYFRTLERLQYGEKNL